MAEEPISDEAFVWLSGQRPRSISGTGARAACSASAALAHQPRLVAVPVAHLLGLALVVQLLASPKRDRNLGAAFVVEIDAQRHDRHALAFDAFGKFGDFLGVQQQLARP